jgi:hypothetical protein
MMLTKSVRLDPCDLARQIEALTITSKERYISSTPERILDAPDLINDFCQSTNQCSCLIDSIFDDDFRLRFKPNRLG